MINAYIIKILINLNNNWFPVILLISRYPTHFPLSYSFPVIGYIIYLIVNSLHEIK